MYFNSHLKISIKKCGFYRTSFDLYNTSADNFWIFTDGYNSFVAKFWILTDDYICTYWIFADSNTLVDTYLITFTDAYNSFVYKCID